MYQIIPKRLIFLGFGWLIVGLMALSDLLNQLVGQGIRWSAIPSLGWLCLALVTINPVWRAIWSKAPKLNRWFPDLNGTWNVELCSNWPRQEQLLDAAKGTAQPVDMKTCDEADLAPLRPMHLSAEIHQTWWKIEMRLTNPKSNSPIKDSNTISVVPFPGEGIRKPAICYFYKQENDTSNVSDDVEFYGAARLTYDVEADRLEGVAWTARMWRRAMNTASSIVFSRT